LSQGHFKGNRFSELSILDIKAHSKATETFQYTYFSISHPPGVKKGFIKGEAHRPLRANSSETAFATAASQFKTNLIQRGYPETLVSTTLAINPLTPGTFCQNWFFGHFGGFEAGSWPN